MTKEQIRIAVAEICGWHWSYCKDNQKWAWFFKYSSYKSELSMRQSEKSEFIYCLPNYSESLDACAEFEKDFNEAECRKYNEILCKIVIPLESLFPPFPNKPAPQWLFHANSLQRCEAFLRLKGKWIES